jgi:rhamnogalacturonan endolyase
MRALVAAIFILGGAHSLFAAFSLTTNSYGFLVDTGAGLVFQVLNNGDISSLKYNGDEYQATYWAGSHVNSGFGGLYSYVGTNGATNYSGVNVKASLVGTNFAKITVTCSLTNPVTGTTNTLIHYYIARAGYSQITMATHYTDQPGLTRFIARLRGFPNGPVPGQQEYTDINPIEAGDISAFSMTNPLVQYRGQTRSKHYSNHRMIDWRYTGTMNNVTKMAAVWMVRSNHEGDSGGPFYRCLITSSGWNTTGGQVTTGVYEIIYYGEGQTEAPRVNVLNGPYTLVFTPGTPPPAQIDTSWLTNSGFNLIGYVPDSLRGRVVGTASGVPAGFQTVVGFSNTRAQYWCIATNGAFQSPLMIPGTYRQVLYKRELEVATNNGVVVGTNATTIRNIVSQEYKSPLLTWRIGEWDGSPVGFLNATKSPTGLYPDDLMCTQMHPSDIRMASWSATACSTNPYVIGTSIPSQFPCYQWMGVNGAIVIKFNLTPAQIRSHTVRIGITTAYAGARHQVKVNSYTSGYPAGSVQPDSRTLTVGTYRGNNTLETYAIPASAFVAGTNTLTLSLVSGSYNGGTFLSPGIGFDCVELD